ncbi:MAG: HipA N-terminal domain-containing protein [Ornithinibacter sp.]
MSRSEDERLAVSARGRHRHDIARRSKPQRGRGQAGQPCGDLVRGAEGGEFRYVEEYLDAKLPAPATTLPLGLGPVMVRGGAVPPFSAGLLLEGRRLTGLRRAVRTSADDELSLLLAVGHDPVGEVQVVPTGDPPHGDQPLIMVDQDFSRLVHDRTGRRDVFRQVAYAWLTGNGDVHAKNLSILGTEATGEWRSGCT